MALESGTFINSLVATNPAATDALAAADDHMRLIKSTIKNTFPNIDAAITATEDELNILDGATLTTAELNILDGVTSTAAELNILDGVTSTAAELNTLDGFTGTFEDLNYAKDLRATGVTSTEFDYLDGVTSAIQTQLDALTTSISAVNVYPSSVALVTTGTSYTFPAGTKAALLRVSGGGGGGSRHVFSGNNGYNGTDGADTTVTSTNLSLAITAKGGARGVNSNGGLQPKKTGDSGGDYVLRAQGAEGGFRNTNNYDIASHNGEPANLVVKLVSGSLGGEVLTLSLGAGGAGGSSAEDGESGYVEIMLWS